jgi:hypothetical protein
MKHLLLIFITAFILHSPLFILNSHAATIQLPQTGQYKCYNTTGTEIPCAGTGQDGDVRAGVAWPSPRFVDNGDGTITDNLTGLVWLKNANCFGENTGWYGAINNSDALASGTCGLNDGSSPGQWRLPTVRELESLLNEREVSQASWLIGAGFSNVPNTSYCTYWSSTAIYLWVNYVYKIDMSTGGTGYSELYERGFVWPVRKALSSFVAPSLIAKTGQTLSYWVSSDDGALQPGIAWPTTRFTDNGDQTITDNLTGLIWKKDLSTEGYHTWQQALDYILALNNQNHLGYNDWRLPNRNELWSLINFGERNSGVWLEGKGFIVAPTSLASSTTDSSSVDNFWAIDLAPGLLISVSKTNPFYSVWPVRGGIVGQAPISGVFTFFKISDSDDKAINSQQTNKPFVVKVSALDAYGNVASNINDWVDLKGTLSTIKPSSRIKLTNGTATATIMLDRSGSGQKIIARYGAIQSESNLFDVTGTSSVSSAKLDVTVKFGFYNKAVAPNASVTLRRLPSPDINVTTDTNGLYRFISLLPGRYKIRAVSDTSRSEWTDIDITNEKPAAIDLILFGTDKNTAQRTPVLLVPGMMGSSYTGGIIYPNLPSTEPLSNFESWKNGCSTNILCNGIHGLLDPYSLAGWQTIIAELESRGYEIGVTIFPVPYDWTLPIDDISQKYLEKAIERAKTASGMAKVNIIAHSMGGLVTRSYIDSFRFKEDIDKFAMVGTPNRGATNTYYLREGGDPHALDSDDYFSKSNIIDFYTNSVRHLANARGHSLLISPLPILKRYNNWQVSSFIQKHVPSAKQLLPTYPFLIPDGLNDPILMVNEENIWLKLLNGRTDTATYFSDKNITARLFAGSRTASTSETPETIENVKVTYPLVNLFSWVYKDGVPFHQQKSSDGDGTVLESSVSLSGLTLQPTKDKEHSGLIKVFTPELVDFVDPPPATKVTAKQMLISTTTDQTAFLPTTLGLHISGRVSPIITSQSGTKTGIDFTTGSRLLEIGNSTAYADQESASLTIANIENGIYSVTLDGTDNEDATITLSLMDGTNAVEKEFHYFSHAAPTTFTISVNTASPDKISVIRSPEAPTAFQADAVGATSLSTRLTWAASISPDVTGYNVYSRLTTEPYLIQLGTTTQNSFDTSHPWPIDTTIISRVYAVAAIKADGTESFLSDLIENNDRDHDGLTDDEELTIGTDPSKADTDGDGYSDALELSHGSNPLELISVPTVTLSITKTGTGSGNISVTNAGAVCGTSCEPTFNLNSLVSLTATPDKLSLFGIWTGCSSIGPNGECIVTMSAYKGVDAFFILAPKAKIGTTEYASFAEAYTAASSSAPTTIMLLEDTLSVATVINKLLILQGGHLPSFARSTSGYTTLQGPLIIRSGRLIVDRVAVK